MTALDSEDRVLRESVGDGLAKLGFAVPNDASFRGAMGRNISGVVDLGDQSVFVKRIRGMDGAGRFDRSRAFHDCGLTPDAVRSPRLLGADRDTLLLVYEYVPDADGLSTSFISEGLTAARIQDIASLLAALHSSAPRRPSLAQWPPPLLPPWGRNAVHIELLEGATSGYLDVWRIIQGDDELRRALHALVAAPYDPRPVHGDVRVDQLLADDEGLWLIDWEEFRLGDAARDVGSLAGELLYSRMRHLIDPGGDDAPITESQILLRGAELIDRARLDIALFWRAYISTVDRVDEGMASRVANFIGWQLFDRALAAGSFLGRISAFDRAIAGVGRNLVLQGDAFLPVIGLDEEAA